MGEADMRSSGSTRRVERLIEEHVAEHAELWFPGHDPASAIQLRALSHRPRSLLYAVQVGGGTAAPRILAKVRRDVASDNPSGQRPRLRSDVLPASAMTTLEYEGLCSLFGLFGDNHPRFAAVRPLDQLATESTILMEYVDAPTLRQLFIAESRLTPPWRSQRIGRAPDVWRAAGEWLGTFHQSVPAQSLPDRQSTRDDVIDQFHSYHDFLTSRLGADVVGDLARQGAALAAEVLPQRLPLAVGHGDYAPRNMFVDDRGRLAVFDPMPRWQVPCYEDLCRFLVALRLLGLQLHSHGMAYSQQWLESREAEVIGGYYGARESPLPEIRCYQLLILLDKWSALVEAPGSNVRGRLQMVSLRLAHRYISRQGMRLLRLARTARR